MKMFINEPDFTSDNLKNWSYRALIQERDAQLRDLKKTPLLHDSDVLKAINDEISRRRVSK